MRLSCTDMEIRGFKDIVVTSLTFLGSHDVIGHVTIGLCICGFLLVVHCNHASILHRYGNLKSEKILGSRPWPFGVTWRHRSRDHWTWHVWFLIGGPLEPSIYLAPIWRYKASNLHLPMLKAKSSLRMLRVTWPVSRGSKMTTYLEFPRPYCL